MTGRGLIIAELGDQMRSNKPNSEYRKPIPVRENGI
jgi:hypothetical protein